MALRRFVLPTLLVVTVLGVVWIGGLRVFVLSPHVNQPNAGAALVWGVPTLSLIDSPDSFCERELGDISSMCRRLVVRKVRDRATVLTRLPYTPLLDWLAGTPDEPPHQGRSHRYDV
ncbi:MAG: hypothetical protein AAF580_06645 [Pseudomonadota bacterium]